MAGIVIFFYNKITFLKLFTYIRLQDLVYIVPLTYFPVGITSFIKDKVGNEIIPYSSL